MLGLEGGGRQDTSFSDCVQGRVARRAGGQVDGGGGGVGGGREGFIIQRCKAIPSRYNPSSKLDVHLVRFSSFPPFLTALFLSIHNLWTWFKGVFKYYNTTFGAFILVHRVFLRTLFFGAQSSTNMWLYPFVSFVCFVHCVHF